MLRDFLVLRGAQVSRETTSVVDGEPGTTVTVLTTLPRAAIWSTSQSQSYISDKMYRTSSHVLITEPNDYTFTDDDKAVIYNGVTYLITGPSDDVMLMHEVMMTGLDLKI